MSIRQGSSVIAGGIPIDNTPTSSSTNAVSSGGVYTALSGKADTDFTNTNMTDYVVESQEPTSSNNYIWYRKYKSGWVEQGCHSVSPGNSWTLPIPMADNAYTLVASYVSSTSTATSQWQYMGIEQYSTYVTPKANGLSQRIYICGKAAN